MNEIFEFNHLKNDKSSPEWVAEVEWHGNYRDYVILKQKDCNNGKTIIIIMLNPGRFKNNKDETYTDSTLRHIRKVFENSGYTLEVLNLFNLSQSSRKKFDEAPNEIKNNENPIDEDGLKKQTNKVVILQWGKIKDDYTKNRRDKILLLIKELGLKEMGLPNKDGSYSHPSHWKPGKIKEFREKILPEIDKQLK